MSADASGGVVVVGGGPAGAALAYLLVRRGVPVTLIERQDDFAREFRGEVLMPSGIDAFRQMGLAGAFDALPQVRPRALEFHLNGRFVRRFALPDFVDEGPRFVSQPAMLEMLVAQCARFPGFRFLRGETVSDLLVERGRVVGVTLRGEAHESVRGALVVGADGRTSAVRRHAGLEVERRAEAFDVVWFKVPLAGTGLAPGTMHAFVRAGQLCLAFHTFDDRLQVGWIIPKGSWGDLRRRGVGDWLEEIARQVGPELGHHLVRHRAALEHPFVLDVVCYLLLRWHAPGVLLIGDAAHPMSPVGGQGINIALRDALVAANHLVPALAAGGAEGLDAAAAAIAAERLPEVAEVERLQRIPPRAFLRRDWWVRPLLAVVGLLVRFPLVRPGARLPAITRAFLNGVRPVELRV